MACSAQAMEEHDAAEAGPGFGPPLRHACERELEPQLDLDEETQHWWAIVYFDHTWDKQRGEHDSYCRFCDAMCNVREVHPQLEDPLMRYVRGVYYRRHS